MKFAEYKNLDLVAINREILEKWHAESCFENTLKLRAGSPEFVFFEGPPSANGMPGIHHVMARSIKDVFCRYKTQKGFLVERKAGWDTHGLPVELGVEKMLGKTFKRVKDVFLFYKCHLTVNLCKFRLTVSAQVFISETAYNLKITVISRNHQQLFKSLG
jgi:isoleucyl-tRNA synthetase